MSDPPCNIYSSTILDIGFDLHPHVRSMYGSVCVASRISHISSLWRRETVPAVRRSSFCQGSTHPYHKYTNTPEHKHTQSLSHAEIRGADWQCLAKEEKRPFRLFACWLKGCCISVLWCWQLNTSRLTVETGYDQSLKISACAISSLISSDSSPAGPTQNSSLSIIHRTNTRRSTGKWEPREW